MGRVGCGYLWNQRPGARGLMEALAGVEGHLLSNVRSTTESKKIMANFSCPNQMGAPKKYLALQRLETTFGLKGSYPLKICLFYFCFWLQSKEIIFSIIFNHVVRFLFILFHLKLFTKIFSETWCTVSHWTMTPVMYFNTFKWLPPKYTTNPKGKKLICQAKAISSFLCSA